MGKIFKKKGEKKMRKKIEHFCVFCGGEVIKKRKNVDFWWGAKLSIFENTPVGICQGCGEEYFDAKISEDMERKAINKEGIIKEIKIPVFSFQRAVKQQKILEVR